MFDKISSMFTDVLLVGAGVILAAAGYQAFSQDTKEFWDEVEAERSK